MTKPKYNVDISDDGDYLRPTTTSIVTMMPDKDGVIGSMMTKKGEYTNIARVVTEELAIKIAMALNYWDKMHEEKQNEPH